MLIACGTGGDPRRAGAELYNPATGEVTRNRPQHERPARGATSGPCCPTATCSSPDDAISLFGRAVPPGDRPVVERQHRAAYLHIPPWSAGPTNSTATLLPTGNALVAGGLVGLISNPQTTATAMLYHPDTNTWTSTSNMTTGRENQTATPLPDG